MNDLGPTERERATHRIEQYRYRTILKRTVPNHIAPSRIPYGTEPILTVKELHLYSFKKSRLHIQDSRTKLS